MLLGTVSGVLFALGMCMALIPEWDSFRPGVVFGAAGVLLGVVTVLVWRGWRTSSRCRSRAG